MDNVARHANGGVGRRIERSWNPRPIASTISIAVKERPVQLGYVILYVPDVEAAVAFYEQAFGLKRRFVMGADYGEVETGATALAFAAEHMADGNGVTIRPARSTQKQAAAVEVAFVTDHPAAGYEKAIAAGAAGMKPAVKKPWGQTVAYVRDLNGFLVELCTPVAPQ